MKDDNNPEPLFKDVMSETNIQNKNRSCADFFETDKAYNKAKPINNKLLSSTLKIRRLAAEGSDKITNDFSVSEFSVEAVDAHENLEFNLCCLNNKEKRRLRYYNATYCIDLHGFRIEEARDELIVFIQYALKNKTKYITIIHGSSTSSKNQKNTLKSFCVHWLKHMPEVRAFCSSMTKNNKISNINFGSINVLLGK